MVQLQITELNGKQKAGCHHAFLVGLSETLVLWPTPNIRLSEEAALSCRRWGQEEVSGFGG